MIKKVKEEIKNNDDNDEILTDDIQEVKENEDIYKSIEKPKGRKTDKQMEAFRKAQEALKLKREEDDRIKKEQEEEYKKKLEEKIVKKAVSIKKKQIKAEAKVLDVISDDSEDEPLEKINKKVKKIEEKKQQTQNKPVIKQETKKTPKEEFLNKFKFM